MVKFGIRLACGGDGQHVDSRTCTKLEGPFTCVICDNALTLRAGKATPKHFIHKKKSDCIGNTDEHREMADALGVKSETEEEPNVEVVPNIEEEPIVKEEPSIKEEPIVEDVPSIKEEPNVVMADEVSNDIINEALEFVINDMLKEEKCSSCKKTGTGYHQMFTEEAKEKFDLNDLHVCSECFEACPMCKGVCSKKRMKRVEMCFTCDFVKSKWLEEAQEGIKNMTSIPETVDWLSEERKYMVSLLLSKKQSARTVRNFMKANKHKMFMYKEMVGAEHTNKAVSKVLKKARRDVQKNREKNQRSRERMSGIDATKRYDRMYSNKREQCPSCGKANKRRYMVKYESTMGAIKYCCFSCGDRCKCSAPCSKNDLERFGGTCFECLAWSKNRSEAWKTDKESVLNRCKEGDIDSMCTLYIYSPLLEKGKYVNDKIVHVPSSELPAVSRRDHPDFTEMINVILVCRKF